MAFRIPNVPKIDTLRLYKALATWNEEKNGKKTTYRQEFIISATNPKDAYAIAHNHLPMKLTNGTSPSVKDDVDLNLQDFGIPMPNRTYYSSPIVPNSYELIKPGPVEEVKDDSSNIEPVPLQKDAVHIEIKEEPVKQNDNSNDTDEISFNAVPDDVPDNIDDYIPEDDFDDIPDDMSDDNQESNASNNTDESSIDTSTEEKPFVTDADQLSPEQMNQMIKTDEQQSQDAIETFESNSQHQQQQPQHQDLNNLIGSFFTCKQGQFIAILRLMKVYGEILQSYNDTDFNDLSQEQREIYQWMAEFKDYGNLCNSIIINSNTANKLTNDKSYKDELTNWIQFQIEHEKGD